MVVPGAANVPLSNALPSLVAVWAVFPLFTHFTTVPALIVGEAGVKAKSVMLTVSTVAPEGGGLLVLPEDVGPELKKFSIIIDIYLYYLYFIYTLYYLYYRIKCKVASKV